MFRTGLRCRFTSTSEGGRISCSRVLMRHVLLEWLSVGPTGTLLDPIDQTGRFLFPVVLVFFRSKRDGDLNRPRDKMLEERVVVWRSGIPERECLVERL